MEDEVFIDLLAQHLMPMLSGTTVGNPSRSIGTNKLVAFKDPCVLFLKPNINERYRVELWRSQPFSPEEKRLVEFFIEELSEIESSTGSPFFQDLMASLPRRVFSRLLMENKGRMTLERAIRHFEALASQTYEGKPVVAALGLTGSTGHGDVQLEELLKEDFARVLSNGFDSMYLSGSDGRIFNIAYLPLSQTVSFAPHRLASIAAWCESPLRAALVLNRNGEILIFKDKLRIPVNLNSDSART